MLLCNLSATIKKTTDTNKERIQLHIVEVNIYASPILP